MTWDLVRTYIEAGDSERTASAVRALTSEQRREVAKALPGYLKERREADRWRFLDQQAVVPLLVAGLGSIGGPVGATSWVFRPPLRVWANSRGRDHVPLMTRVVADRPPEWRLDLARRIAGRLRATNLPWEEGALWRFAARLLTDAGEEPPVDDAFVIGWLVCGAGPAGLGTDPFLDALTPRLFEADGAGRILARTPVGRDRVTWEGTLDALASDGRLKREMLLDGCLSRFLRGGAVNDLKWFVSLHDTLAPTLEEVTARTRDYLRLLPAAPAPVAEVALREVRRVDEVGGLDDAAFTEAAEALLFRPEKKLVRAALSWLGRTAGRRVDLTLNAVTVAFGHEVLDLRERAVKLVVKHASKAREETLRAVRDAAVTLPGDLREPIAASCGAVETDEPAGEFVGVAPYVPREMPPPIGSVAELAEETAAVLGSAAVGWREGERLLAGLVTFAYSDPDGTRTALQRVIDASASAQWAVARENPANSHPMAWMGAAVRAAVRRPEAPRGGLLGAVSRAIDSVRPPALPEEEPGERVSTPQRMTHRRMREAAGLIGKVPVLLATPTAANGHLDPDVLVTRLETLEAAGIDAPALDLEQALLRLPRSFAPAVAVRARKLTSVSGHIAANVLASGRMPDPEVTTRVLTLPRRTHMGYPTYGYEDLPVVRVLASVSADGLRGTAEELCRVPPGGRWKRADRQYHYGTCDWWPAIMPSHREVIAAHLLPEMADLTEGSYGETDEALLGLAEADGPVGDALATVLAFALASREQSERSAAVDALLILAGRGQLPATELGTAIGRLMRHKLTKVNRLVAALGGAVDAGGHAEVWAMIVTALPDALPEAGEPARTGMADLLALATRCAEATGARAEIPGLAAVADRGGSSRLVKEATRLQRAANPS